MNITMGRVTKEWQEAMSVSFPRYLIAFRHLTLTTLFSFTFLNVFPRSPKVCPGIAH